jgi:flagellar motor switch/type III secretory pathway protein FliN
MAEVIVDLGRARLEETDAAGVGPGAVVPLDRAPGDPVVVRVDGRPAAEGVLIEEDGALAVRITRVI